MSLFYREPTDQQLRRERLFILIFVCITVLLVLAVGAQGDQGQPEHGRPPRCVAEDEVVMKVEVAAFDLERGDLRCVHIDYLEPTP